MVSMADMERMAEWGMPDRREKRIPPAETIKQGYFRVQPKQVPPGSRPAAERLSEFFKDDHVRVDQNGNIVDRNFGTMQNSDPTPEQVDEHQRFLLEQLHS